MRYMMLVYTQEGLPGSPEQVEAVRQGHRAVMDDAARLGVLEVAEPLKPTQTATTIRMDKGGAIVTDGPFAETKEQLAGYYILNCKDLDEAIDWASRMPTACGGATGCIEIRPIADISSR